MADPELQALQAALDEQLALQREADHRVKNNLQLISSLLLLQSRRTADEPTRQALKATLQRVGALSAAHRQVIRRDGAEWIEVGGLARELVGDLAGSAGRDDIEIALALDEVILPARHAAPVALLINELVGDALRHGCPPGAPGRIEVSVRRDPAGFQLAVRDWGREARPEEAVRGFGLTICQLLAQQLRGTFQTVAEQPGLRHVVTAPMETQPSAV